MRILITGGSGMLANALAAELPRRGHEAVALGRSELDVTDASRAGEIIAGARPDAVIHCAAYTDVDGAEAREEYARIVNGDAAGTVARACALAGARFVYPSTDYVFDGSGTTPYQTDSAPRPINAYGRSKLAGERATLESGGNAMVVRTSWLYGDGGRNFVRTILERARAIERGEVAGPLRVVDDQRGRPTWTHSLAGLIAGLLERDAPAGVYHATDAGEATWYGFAAEALRLAGLDGVPIEPVTSDAFPRPAPRPRYSVLDLERTEAIVGPLRDWRDALARAIEAVAY